MLTAAHAQSVPAKTDSLVARADSMLAQGKLQEAERAYKAALKLDKNLLRAYRGLGKIDIEREKWGDAGEKFGEILKRDPENKEAHYYRGICYRETGKSKALLLRKIDWNKSKKHFQWVISRDSLFQDVLYQYARLLRYRRKYAEAVEFGQREIRLRPDLVRPQVGLFRLYRYFITHKSEKKAIAWLREQPWDQACFAIGEKLRRDRKLAEADSIFQALLADSLGMPRQPIYLALARIRYAQNRADEGERFFWRAVDEIDNAVAADLVLEDVKYILNDEELREYRSLGSRAEKIDFFHRLWAKRDPTPAAATNVRLAEHYRRLLYAEKNYEYDGFRTWFNSPDKLHYLAFPKTYKLNHEFNDKGLIYIRQGPPDEREVTVAADLPTNESWRYWKRDGHPEMIFHFLIDTNATGNNWRLAPMLTDPRMVEDRITWGSLYHRLLRATELERLPLAEEMAEQSRKAVEVGMSTDRHTWGKEMEPLEMPFAMASFRGRDRKTRVEIYFALPVSTLKEAAKESGGELRIEKGLSVYDSNWRPIFEKRDTLLFRSQEQAGEDFLGQFAFTVAADSYSVGFDAHPLGTQLLAGWKADERFPDFSSARLAVSDIELADRIEPATGAGEFVKNGLEVVPNPRKRFRRRNPAFLYFEVYNLRRDQEGKTAFSIEYTLTLVKGKKGGVKKLFGIFGGGGKSSITVRIDREGTTSDSIEHMAVDVSKLKPGEYTLEVRVEDKNARTSATRKAKVKLE